MSEPYIVAGLFGLLGVAVGALLQFWFNRRIGQEARYLELKSTAYSDYVNAVGAVAFASAQERPQALEKVTASKGRICVFGDARVVNALVNLERTSLNLANPEAQNAFVALLQVMREQSIAVDSVAEGDFRELLL